MLAGTVHHHMKKYDIVYRGIDLSMEFLQDLYVDDTSNSFHEMDVAQEFYQTVKASMARDGFKLCKSGNQIAKNYAIYGKIPKITVARTPGETIERYLGSTGMLTMTRLSFNLVKSQAKKLKGTKRNLLRIAAMFYDQLCLICPVTLQPKLIFKRLCLDKLDWDVTTPEEIAENWRNLLEDVKVVEFETNRHVHIEIQNGEIIEFTDLRTLQFKLLRPLFIFVW